MKLVRYLDTESETRWGIEEDGGIRGITGDPFSGYEETGRRIEKPRIRILPPVLPSKIVAVGLNYKKHTSELAMNLPDEPVLFIKPQSSVIGHLDTIVYPRGATRVDYEAELAVIIGRRCRNVSEAEAGSVVLGYTCLNDVTERDMQKRDGQWTRSKSFDTFSPIGPCIAMGINPDTLGIRCFLNGGLVQDSNTSELVFSVARLVSFVSGIMTLEPQDVISTGTPEGVGPMERGDTVEVEIDGIGRLVNFVG
jgi:2-keto-4-pentenoate hydratase/2-oxohepta-3-ene-1,7-dioic acid hydratase in catechol pathway